MYKINTFWFYTLRSLYIILWSNSFNGLLTRAHHVVLRILISCLEAPRVSKYIISGGITVIPSLKLNFFVEVVSFVELHIQLRKYFLVHILHLPLQRQFRQILLLMPNCVKNLQSTQISFISLNNNVASNLPANSGKWASPLRLGLLCKSLQNMMGFVEGAAGCVRRGEPVGIASFKYKNWKFQINARASNCPQKMGEMGKHITKQWPKTLPYPAKKCRKNGVPNRSGLFFHS